MSGRIIKSYKHHKDVLALAFSPDSKYIASGGLGKVVIFNYEKKIKTIINYPNINSNYKNLVHSISFNPDSKSIAVCTQDHRISIWSIDGKLIRSFGKVIMGFIDYTSDGKNIISHMERATMGNRAFPEVKIWSIDGKLQRALKRNKNYQNRSKESILCADVSSDGKYIIVGYADHTLSLWDINGRRIKEIKDNYNWVTSVAFSMDGKSIIFITDYDIILYKLKN